MSKLPEGKIRPDVNSRKYCENNILKITRLLNTARELRVLCGSEQHLLSFYLLKNKSENGKKNDGFIKQG